MAQLKRLNMLPVNKTVVFYSPIQGKNTLVRTGTIPDGSCFYHSLLHAYSRDYIFMNTSERSRYVSDLRRVMGKKIDKETWSKLSNGMISLIPYQENVLDCLSDLYRYVIDQKYPKTRVGRKFVESLIKKDKETEQLYAMILEILTLENFEKHILPKAYEKSKNKYLNTTKKTVLKYSEKALRKEFKEKVPDLSKTKIEKFVDKFVEMLDLLNDVSEDYAFKRYISNLSNSDIDVDSYTINLISEKFNRDVYFIDASNRMPYQNSNGKNIKKRKSIIVMWTGGNHYEVVGKLLPGNRVQREFDHTDPIIQTIYTFLTNPDKAAVKYPKLIPFLPKDARGRLDINISDSEEDRNEDLFEGSDMEGSDVEESMSDDSSDDERHSGGNSDRHSEGHSDTDE